MQCRRKLTCSDRSTERAAVRVLLECAATQYTIEKTGKSEVCSIVRGIKFVSFQHKAEPATSLTFKSSDESRQAPLSREGNAWTRPFSCFLEASQPFLRVSARAQTFSSSYKIDFALNPKADCRTRGIFLWQSLFLNHLPGKEGPKQDDGANI